MFCSSHFLLFIQLCTLIYTNQNYFRRIENFSTSYLSYDGNDSFLDEFDEVLDIKDLRIGFKVINNNVNNYNYEVPENQCIIVIRGSSNINDEVSKENWKRNLNCGLSKYKEYVIHKGFFHAAQLISNNVIFKKTLRKYECLGKEKKISIIGHSLGAGVSLTLGLLLEKNVFQVITFASPKVFHMKSNLPNFNIIRFNTVLSSTLNNYLYIPTDPVTFIPYNFVDYNIYESSELKINLDKLLLSKFNEFIHVGLLIKLPWDNIITAHFPQVYFKLIQMNLCSNINSLNKFDGFIDQIDSNDPTINFFKFVRCFYINLQQNCEFFLSKIRKRIDNQYSSFISSQLFYLTSIIGAPKYLYKYKFMLSIDNNVLSTMLRIGRPISNFDKMGLEIFAGVKCYDDVNVCY